MSLHWAEDDRDATETLCGLYVDVVLADENGDITSESFEKFLLEPISPNERTGWGWWQHPCPDCKKEARKIIGGFQGELR